MDSSRTDALWVWGQGVDGQSRGKATDATGWASVLFELLAPALGRAEGACEESVY